MSNYVVVSSPSAAFKDLWETISKGKPWTGVIKNRVKNGDFYWVVANVIPIKKMAKLLNTCRLERNQP